MEIGTFMLVLFAVVGFTGLCALLGSFYVVEQQQEGVVERFGKFVRTAKAGLNLKIPFIEGVYKIDLRVRQLDVLVETKTKDNVFVKTKVSVQYNVSDPVKALYKLKDEKTQISSYVFDVVRSQIPKLTLDEVFEKKDDVATAVKGELSDAMDDFGYLIVKALVTDIDPDERVKASMNEINAAARLREAAQEKAEAEKILTVKQAEAEAEAKTLQGQGVANQRSAIVNGLKDSVSAMAHATGTDAQHVMALVLMTQYFDTLNNIGNHGKSNTIMLPHGPGAVTELQAQLLNAFKGNKE
jgi:regulator of protease activity HflC (stomatin/prohibitin superfamily)